MDLKEAVKTRKSIRGYKTSPVPRKILEELLSRSLRAPSAINIQPWEIAVVTGENLEKMKLGNVRMMESGIWPEPDMPMPSLAEVHRKRQSALGAQLYGLLDIQRSDIKKSYEWYKKSMRFFDSPVVFFVYADRRLNITSTAFDCGLLVENIALLALEYDLGTCIHEQGVFYPAVIRKFSGIPDSHIIIVCISIGYPDWDYPANKIYSEREPLENISIWHGFDKENP